MSKNDDMNSEALSTLTASIQTIKELVEVLDMEYKNQRVKDAVHKELLEHYLEMVNSGDCGNWNPEEEDIVMKSRHVLSYPKE